MTNLENEGIKSVRLLQLDVTDQASVDAAAKHISQEHGHLDVLINNAGISLEPYNGPAATETSVETVITTYQTNFFGAVRVTHAFVPLLRKSSNPVISNISSETGSSKTQSSPDNSLSIYQAAGYNTSKAALNHYTIVIASSFKEARVNSITPGWVATNINGNYGAVDIKESVAGVIKHSVLIDKSGPTCTFMDRNGQTVPW